MELGFFQIESARKKARFTVAVIMFFVFVFVSETADVRWLFWLCLLLFGAMVGFCSYSVQYRFLPNEIEVRISRTVLDFQTNKLKLHQRSGNPLIDRAVSEQLPSYQDYINQDGFVIKRYPRCMIRDVHSLEGKYFAAFVIEMRDCKPLTTSLWRFRLRNIGKAIVINRSKDDPLAASNLRLLEEYLESSQTE